jgi:hypothetical protein
MTQMTQTFEAMRHPRHALMRRRRPRGALAPNKQDDDILARLVRELRDSKVRPRTIAQATVSHFGFFLENRADADQRSQWYGSSRRAHRQLT